MITYQNINDLPTGSLLLERGGSSVIIYVENDLHTHTCILVWIDSITGEFKKTYEKHVTRPFLFDMYIDKSNPNAVYCPVNLAQLEVGDSINETVAYKPRDELLNHPRYMEVISKHIEIFQGIFLRNICYRMFVCKYFPSLVDSYIKATDDPYEAFDKLKGSENILKDAVDFNIRTAQSCIDIVCMFMKLTYRELCGEDILTNIQPRILINDLIEHTPDFYKVYQNDHVEVVRTTKTNNLYNFAFLWVFMIFGIIFVACSLVGPIFIRKMFSERTIHAMLSERTIRHQKIPRQVS